jgi:peptidoglycan/LPS O-acetylase OafA/YrhL
VLYEVVKHAPVRNWLTPAGEWLAIVFVPVAFALYFFIQRTASHPAYEWIFPIIALTAAFFSLTLFACEYQGRLSRIFSWTPIRYLGNMSYSYYLIHGLTLKAVALLFVIVLGARLSLPIFVIAIFVGFAATWISSTLLFWLIEKRFSLQPKIASMSVAPALHLQPGPSEHHPVAAAAKAASAAATATDMASTSTSS